MIEKYRASTWYDTETTQFFDAGRQRCKHPRGHLCRVFVSNSLQEPRGRVMLFRIKIAAYGDERVRFAVEQTLDEQSSLQRLSLPFLRRDELSLGPARLEKQS